MSFNDDEQIVSVGDFSAEKPAPFIAGKTKATIINKTEAPLEETKFKVMLELTGSGSGKDRSGVDLVTILDVSGSMGGEKLAKMKIAMQFVIKKLSPIDRLSVVTFSRGSSRLCPLRQVTETCQKEIEDQVNALVAGGNTNISAGLETGLKVLNDRKLTTGRVAGIMLMSDGEQNAGTDAAKIAVGNVPVYTFGFGSGSDPKVLKGVADNSIGGTFSDVTNQDNLSIAFSQCLAGLLTVVVQDLKLTVTQQESTIEKVFAGNYPQTRDEEEGSVTVSFGDLYDKELRKVIVDLLLPTVKTRTGADVLEFSYTYKAGGGKLFEANPLIITVTRIGTTEPEREEVVMEENRIRTAQMMKQARVMADDNKLEGAQDKLIEAENFLQDAVEEPNPLIEMLKYELRQLLKLMESPEIYKSQGRAFALSSETSHDRQRLVARGDTEKFRLFSTPRMDAYLEQAKAFVDNPSMPLPTADDDVKQEVAADPLASIAGALSYYIQTAIQALKSIDDILNNSR